MTSTGAQAAIAVACEQVPVAVPRRKRAAATKKKTAKPRRHFQRLTLGPSVTITDGSVARWATEVEVFAQPEGYAKKWVSTDEAEAGQYELVLDRFTRRPNYRRVRLLDEDGFPTTGQTGWSETERCKSEPAVIKFEEGQPLPKTIRTASAREQRERPDECVGGLRLIYTEPAKEPGKGIEWFPNDRDHAVERRQFITDLRELTVDEIAELNPLTESAPAQEQWFRVELSDLQLEAGAWRNFPVTDEVGGWCCRLVTPQPPLKYEVWWGEKVANMDEPWWVYVQFPRHFFVEWAEFTGELRESWPTDEVGWKEGKDAAYLSSEHPEPGKWGYRAVECGMWVPRSVLKPISVEEAADIYAKIMAL